MKPVELLCGWIERQAGDQVDWFKDSIEGLEHGVPERELHIFLGMAPRRLGKEDLLLTAADIETASRLRDSWKPTDWRLDGAARVAGLLVYRSDRAFSELFRDLRCTADVRELIALYRGLPLYPEPETLDFEVGEGLRSNMIAVFESIAHENPYPRDHFDEHRWNHMVLKAVFVGSTISPIIGLDDRANADLARMLLEFAHERWAADRPVSPEIWRCIGPFATEDTVLSDLQRTLNGTRVESRAAALALSASPSAKARRLLETRPEAGAISSGRLTWDTINEVSK